MKLTSPAFKHNEMIPAKYTCQGDDINPALEITDIPAKTKSMALIMFDPDAPLGTWDHWVMWGIMPEGVIEEDSVPDDAIQGRNSWGTRKYGGPCPPEGKHRYVFIVYALNTGVHLDTGDKKQLKEAIEGYIIEEATLIGLYEKSYILNI